MRAVDVLMTLWLIKVASSEARFSFNHATAERPAPEKAKRGGEDANYSDAQCIAVADGVGGWNTRGIDPSLFSRRLMKEIAEALSRDASTYIADPRQLAVLATRNNDQVGTSTLVIVTLDSETGLMRSANIGDSGYMLLRRNAARLYEVVFRSTEQQHSFNFPFQIGTGGDDPALAEVNEHVVLAGDLIVVGSDGLFDNLFDKQIIKTVNEQLGGNGSLQDAANALLEQTYKLSLDKTYMSPFALHAKEHDLYFRGGKSDDITIVLAEVVAQKIEELDDSSSL